MRQRVQERVDREAAGAAGNAGGLKPPVADDGATGGGGPGAAEGGGAGDGITSRFIRDCLFANELGDGALYAALHRGGFVFAKNSEEWYYWTGQHWERDVMGRAAVAVEAVVARYLEEHARAGRDRDAAITAGVASGVPPKEIERSEAVVKLDDLRDALLKRAIQLRGDRRRTACLKFAHTIADPLAIINESFDAHPMLFPCANGVIDLETGRLLDGRPADYLTKASPVAWAGIDAPCPLWERSLLEIFGGDASRPAAAEPNVRAAALSAYLRRLIGYSMTGLVTEKIFPVLYGKTGWNGRSLIMDIVSWIMGEMAGVIPSEMLLAQKFGRSSAGPSPDIMGLKGIRLAIASEVDENQAFSAARIKWLTGRDELVGRNPHDTYQTRFRPTHKLFLMTNTQPEAPSSDTAFWHRMALIEFDVSFVNRDPQEPHERRAILDLDRQIRAEAPGILAWMVRGCLEWQSDGLAPPREITAATEKYRQAEDLVADYIYECCDITDPHAIETATALYTRFVAWYEANIGKKPRSGTWFGKQLSRKYEKWKSNGKVVYQGIALKGSPDQGGLV